MVYTKLLFEKLFTMEDIATRIKSVMDSLELTVTDFSKKIGVSWTAVNNYTKGRIPDGRTLSAIKQKFDVNINWLLTGDGSMFIEKQHLQTTNAFFEPLPIYAQLPKVIVADAEGNENVIMVPHYAQAGYLDGYGDTSFLEQLPTYRLPKLSNGTFRMFEVKGHSMTPTLHDGSIAVGEWCESFNDITDDSIYIVVTREDGIVIKRVLNRVEKYGNLFLKSDNRKEYPSYTVKPEDVLELWKLKTAFLFNFSNPADMYDRVTDLEAEVVQIKSLLNK